MKNILLIALSFLALSFTKQDKVQEVVLHTTAECGQCKDRIEEKLNYTKGIVYADLNYKTQDLTVKFKTSKITLNEIKTIVSKLGYDIDDVKADPKAQSELPACCQPNGMEKHKH
jgi:mercuric ion binding protein